MSYHQQNKKLYFFYFFLIDLATPNAIGIDPPTIAEEYILYFGKQREIDLPSKIFFSNNLFGTPFNKHW